MKTRHLIYALALLLAACTGSQQEQEAPPRPNILLVLTDDQGWGDLGFHGNTVLETPNLDSLFTTGISLDRFYVSPVCAPTRASLLTGRYHLATGTSWVTHRREVMRAEEVTLAEWLGQHGYATALFGKWHNGKQYPNNPMGQGFQHMLGFTEGHFNNYFSQVLETEKGHQQSNGYLPNVLTTAAIDWLGQQKQQNQPWLAYMAYNTPHSPFQVPDAYFDKYKAKGLDDRLAAIYGMVDNLDHNMGRLKAALKASGQWENTILIFLGDNGPNGQRYNGGYKGIKSHVDEGGVRVPFLLHYPELQLPAQRLSHTYATHLDVLPTLAALAGLPLPQGRPLHGRNLLPLLQDSTAPWPDRLFFTHQVRRQWQPVPGAVRSHQYLLTLTPEDTALYDLQADPYQQQPITASQPRLADSLARRYGQWFRGMTQDGTAPPPIPVGHPQAPRVALPAQEISQRQGVAFAGKEGWSNDWLTAWQPQATATWQLQAHDSARYKVRAQLAAQSTQGTQEAQEAQGTLSLYLNGEKISEGPLPTQLEAPVVPSPDRVPRGEVYAREWGIMLLGSISLPPGPSTLTVEYSGPAKNTLDLKALQLTEIE